jgi:cytochrome P450
MNETLDVELLSDSFFANPFPTFERLRTHAPVYFFAPIQSFILTRASDIEEFVKSPSFTSRRASELLGALGLLNGDAASQKMLADWSRVVFFQDPPRHTLLRQLISTGFSPAAVESIRPRIARLAERALEKARRQGEMNLVTDFSEPIALNSIAELFAIPDKDRPQFMKWSCDVLKPAGAGANSEEAKRTIKQSSNDMTDYMSRLAHERRKAPGDDLVSRFIAEEDGNAQLAGEAALQSFQMVGAGFITSMNQITNTVLLLLKQPEQLQRLRAEPSLLKSAIEECLRYEPAIMSVHRMCVEDTELRGAKISKGQFVYAMMASANRDPEVFADPDRFDITRSRNRHVTFGLGAHYCPGAPLIRLELEEAIRALLTLPRWELGNTPYDYKGSNFQDRGPSALHVLFPQA